MKFSLHIRAEISLENFSFPQVVLMVKEVFDREGLPGFVRAFIQVIEARHLASGIKCKHCQSEHLHVHTSWLWLLCLRGERIQNCLQPVLFWICGLRWAET